MYTDLQAAIDAAAFGDTILLRAGQTYTGHYVLRAKSGTGTIVIRSDAPDASLPGTGVRLVPSGRAGANTSPSVLARIVGRGGAYKTMPLLRTDPGAHGYVLRFIDFDGAAHLGYETLIQLGADTTAAAPYDISLDRVYIHGHRYKGQKRGVTINGTRLSVVNSFISDIKAVNADSQAILGYNGAGPFTIQNNYLEAAGENVMFGGADPAVTNLVPSDIALSGNHFFKPLSWRNAILSTPGGVKASAGSGGSLAAGTHYFKVVAVMVTGTRTAVSAPSAEVSATVGSSGAVTLSWSGVSGADRYRVYRGTAAGRQTVYLETTSTSFVYKGGTQVSGTPATAGTKWTVKNLFELKNAQRVTLNGNIFEHLWGAGQSGYAMMLTPRNGGKAPWTRVRDVTFTNNIVRHVAGVVNITGYDNTATTLRTERITFRNNLFYDVNNTKYGSGARAIVVGDGAAYLVFDGNTFIHTNTSVLYAYGASMPGLVFEGNVLQHNKYGIIGDGTSTGIPALTKYFPGAVVRCNVMAGGKASLYPSPNGFPTLTEWNASFVNLSADDYRLIPGSPVEEAGCPGEVPGADIPAVNAAISGDPDPVTEPTDPVPTDPSPGNLAPTADAGGPYTAAVGALVSVDGTKSADPDGSVLDYRWHWGDEILVRAADLPASVIRGSEWTRTDQADAAGGVNFLNPNKGGAKRSVLAAPSSYIEFTVNAAAGVPYYLWMRLRATSNSYANDSLTIQLNGAVDANGAALARIGTTNGLPIILEQGRGAGVSGWGWTDSMWEGAAAPIFFAQSGIQTIRIQQREDGVAWDQLVLSSTAYPKAPGAAKNDTTIVDEDFGTGTGVSSAHRYARPGVFPLVLVVTDPAGAADADGTTVTVK
jgi:hypothetical protein